MHAKMCILHVLVCNTFDIDLEFGNSFLVVISSFLCRNIRLVSACVSDRLRMAEVHRKHHQPGESAPVRQQVEMTTWRRGNRTRQTGADGKNAGNSEQSAGEDEKNAGNSVRSESKDDRGSLKDVVNGRL
jgi:hypothetical protein